MAPIVEYDTEDNKQHAETNTHDDIQDEDEDIYNIDECIDVDGLIRKDFEDGCNRCSHGEHVKWMSDIGNNNTQEHEICNNFTN